MSTERRKLEIKKVRAEGAKAAIEGRHRETNPYGNDSNRHQWWVGYDDQMQDMESDKADQQ